MKGFSLISGCLLMISLFSCSVSPVEIEYDYDQCHACKMIISDSRFGCEYVTTKGKIYKYDAIECMARDIKKLNSEDLAHIMVTHFYTPKKLEDANNSYFLISKERSSPMGAFLSAYKNLDDIKKDFSNQDAMILSWNELLNHELFDY